jgi:hypothetical protein
MSRHRLIRNQKYDDDEDDDYNYDDYGSSPISPSAEKYLFKRPAPGSSNGSSKTPLALTPTAMSSKTAAAPASTGGHDAKMDAALAQIVDVLGNDFGGHDQDHVVAVLLSFNYDISASLEELTKRPQLQRCVPFQLGAISWFISQTTDQKGRPMVTNGRARTTISRLSLIWKTITSRGQRKRQLDRIRHTTKVRPLVDARSDSCISANIGETKSGCFCYSV